MEGLVDPGLASVPYPDSGYLVMLSVAVWGFDPGDWYWETGYCGSSCKSYIGRSMIEDFLRCHFLIE